MKALPALKDASRNDVPTLFASKLAQCCIIFDFEDAVSNIKSKEVNLKKTLNVLVIDMVLPICVIYI